MQLIFGSLYIVGIFRIQLARGRGGVEIFIWISPCARCFLYLVKYVFGLAYFEKVSRESDYFSQTISSKKMLEGSFVGFYEWFYFALH